MPPRSPEPPVVRVALLAEDRITRAGLRILIEEQPDLTVVGEHAPVDDPGTMLTAARPHVTLLDVDRSTRELIPELIGRLAKKTYVIVLASTTDSEMVSSIFWAGARGLVRKDEPPDMLLKAIRKVDAGEVWLDRFTMGRLLGELARGGEAPTADVARSGRLTLRERQLITVVGQGFGNSEVAARLRISEATVRNHLTSIFRKLQLHSRFELVMYAIRHGLVQNPATGPAPVRRAAARGSVRVKSA